MIIAALLLAFTPVKNYAEDDICISGTTNKVDWFKFPSKDDICNGFLQNFFIYRKGITIKGLNEVHDLEINVADKDIKMFLDASDDMMSGVELDGTSNNDHYNPYPAIYSGAGDPGNKGKGKSNSLDYPDQYCHKTFTWTGCKSSCVNDYYYRAGKVDITHLGDLLPIINDVPYLSDLSLISDGHLYNMPSILPGGTYDLIKWFSGPSGFANMIGDMLHFWQSQVVYGSYTKDGETYENVILNPCGDVIPEVSIEDSSASPGEIMRFKVTVDGNLSGEIAAAGIDTSYVHYYTEDGNATAGIDYEETNGTLEIHKGDTEAYIDVPIIATAHVGTQFYVILDNAIYARIVDDNGTGKIVAGGFEYIRGPFEAWDTFRGDTDGNGNLDDFNISTKIAKKTFSLKIGSLNPEATDTETKEDIDVRYSLWYFNDDETEARDTDIPIGTFDANSSAVISRSFTVNNAQKRMFVHIEYCAKQNAASWAGAEVKLYPYSDCSSGAAAIQEGDISSTRVGQKLLRYHKSDLFAIRPKEFALTPPSSEDRELLLSGIPYDFKIEAQKEDNSTATHYNQNGNNIFNAASLIFADGTYDTSGSLHGALDVNNSNYDIVNGVSQEKGGTDPFAIQISFDDVGQVDINLSDKDWASVDSDDTPNNCLHENAVFNNGLTALTDAGLIGRYICTTQKTVRYIPHHFDVTGIHLRNHRNSIFTYVSNDLNMSAHLDVNISARNANDDITRNFRQGALYYENNISVDLNVSDQNGSNGHPLGNAVEIHAIPIASMLGFGGSDANGTHSIAWNDSNRTQRLMFNYVRKNNQPVNPFIIPGTDVNISVASLYTSSTGGSATISGSGVGDRNATFYFGRAKSSKFFYDNITESSVKTPISVVIYNGPGTTASFDPSVFKPTKEFDWYLATPHNTGSSDGNITLGVSSGAISNANPVTIVNGVNTPAVTVSRPSGTLPAIVNIDFITTNPTDTSSWLIYNKYADSIPTPFYRVRFIGIGSWTGEGKTGHVIGDDINNKKTQRLEW